MIVPSKSGALPSPITRRVAKLPLGFTSESGRLTHFPSVVLRSRLSVGVQMEGVALARRGLRAIGGSMDSATVPQGDNENKGESARD